MSTMLLTAPLVGSRHAPVRAPRTSPTRSSVPRARSRQAALAPARVVRPQVRPTRAAARAAAAPVRLTARGRGVLLTLLVVVAFAVSLFSGAISVAGTATSSAPVRYLTIEPGQTLWGIAGEVAPDDDRRDTIARILELNALPDAGVRAGQQIAVPVRG